MIFIIETKFGRFLSFRLFSTIRWFKKIKVGPGSCLYSQSGSDQDQTCLSVGSGYSPSQIGSKTLFLYNSQPFILPRCLVSRVRWQERLADILLSSF